MDKKEIKKLVREELVNLLEQLDYEFEWEIDGEPTFGEKGFVQLTIGSGKGGMIGPDDVYTGTLAEVLDYSKKEWNAKDVSVYTDGQIDEKDIAKLVKDFNLHLEECD